MGKTLKELRDSVTAVEKEHTAIHNVLYSDIAECAKKLREDDSAFWRRAFIRSVFSFIEGCVYSMKQVAIKEAELLDVILPREMMTFLAEETYQLSESGDVTVKQNYGVRISSNIRFVFKCYAQLYLIKDEIDVGGAGWGSFQESLKVRNRLTHPKCLADTLVSDQDLKHTKQATKWFIKSCHDLRIHAIQSSHIIATERHLGYTKLFVFRDK